MRRPDGSTTCAKGLHPWTEDNIYTNPSTGARSCRACQADGKAKPASERHPQNSLHCKRGHSWTPENTMKRVKIVNGQKQIIRTCRACKKYNDKSYYGTGAEVNR